MSNKPLKIAFACADIRPEGQQGGIAVYVSSIADGMASRGHDITILGKGSERSEKTLESGAKVVFLPTIAHWGTHPKLLPLTDKLARSRTLARYLYSHQDFNIVEFPVWDAEGLYGTRMGHYRSVVHGHTPHVIVNELTEASGVKVSKVDRLLGKLEARCSRQADLYLANSKSAMDTAIERFHLNPATSGWCLLGQKMPTARVEAPDDQIRILFVGRLETRKGILELLQAIPEILKQHSSVRFEIVGIDSVGANGKSHQQSFLDSASEEVRRQVTFHGRLGDDELLALRTKCQIGLLPSLSESFGYVHTEAMSYGAPVVAFDIAATREVVDNGKTGFLVPVGNVPELVSATCKLIADSTMRKQMGEVAYHEMRAHFSIDSMTDCVEHAFRKLLASE